jgi:hypothetical protein
VEHVEAWKRHRFIVGREKGRLARAFMWRLQAHCCGYEKQRKWRKPGKVFRVPGQGGVASLIRAVCMDLHGTVENSARESCDWAFQYTFLIFVQLRLLFNLPLFVSNIYTTCFVLIGQLQV